MRTRAAGLLVPLLALIGGAGGGDASEAGTQSFRPPYLTYHAEHCHDLSLTSLQAICDPTAWVRPTGHIDLEMIFGWETPLPARGRAFGWAGHVVAHDLARPTATATYAVRVRVGRARVVRFPEGHPLPPGAGTGGIAAVSITATHQADPACAGHTRKTLVDFERGMLSFVEPEIVVSATLEGCGAMVPRGRVVIDVEAYADARLGLDQTTGDTGLMHTLVTLDVLEITATT